MYRTAIPSVLVKVSRFGKFSPAKLSVIIVTRPFWLASIDWLVAARTASFRSLPIANYVPLPEL